MNLRSECRERLKIAFDSIRAVNGTSTFILIVDEIALKMISSTIKMMELINYGITSIERLELKRKRFNKIEVCYLIHPSNYELLLEDFPRGEEPQYKVIHVLTLSRITPGIMDSLSHNDNFSKRVRSLRELQLNFTLHADNEVLICANDPGSFQTSLQAEGEEMNKFIDSSAEELCTVLCAHSLFYNVEIMYQKSIVSEKIAFNLKTKLEMLFRNYEKSNNTNYDKLAPQTMFLILERSFDAVSPLVRDFHYMPLAYELKDVHNHKIENFGPDKKTMELDSRDEVFTKYRNSHIIEALNRLPNDFQEFSQTNEAARFDKEDNVSPNITKMADVLKKMPKYIEAKDKYSLHIDLLDEIMEVFKKDEQKSTGELEQTLVTMFTEEGKKPKEKELYDQLAAKVEKVKAEYEKARLVLLGLLCLDLKGKDKSGLIDLLKNTKYRNISATIPQLCGNNLYKLTPKRETKTETDNILDRHQSKLEETVSMIMNDEQTDLKLLRVGSSDTKSNKAPSSMKSTASHGRRKISFEKETISKPRMIIYMASALGYNEMRGLARFEESYQIIYASHSFVIPRQYIERLNLIV